MKVKDGMAYYKAKGMRLAIPIVSYHDLLDEKRKPLFKSYKELYKDVLENIWCIDGHRREKHWGDKIAMSVCQHFFDVVNEKMIYEKEKFLFPDGTGFLQIGFNYNDPNRNYGTTFKGRVYNAMFKQTRKSNLNINITLTPKWRKKLNKHVLTGAKYFL